MRVSIFGLGYVGTVSAGCLASSGHHVVGVDINPEKCAALLEGRAPFVEADLDVLLASGAADGLITASPAPPPTPRWCAWARPAGPTGPTTTATCSP